MMLLQVFPLKRSIFFFCILIATNFTFLCSRGLQYSKAQSTILSQSKKSSTCIRPSNSKISSFGLKLGLHNNYHISHSNHYSDSDHHTVEFYNCNSCSAQRKKIKSLTHESSWIIKVDHKVSNGRKLLPSLCSNVIDLPFWCRS